MAAGWLVARDELWEIVEPLIPSVEAASTGRPRVPDRTAFAAIMFGGSAQCCPHCHADGGASS
jgi:transposase